MSTEVKSNSCIGRKITWNVYGVQFVGIVSSIDRFLPEKDQPEDASLFVKVDKEASKGGCFHGGNNFASVTNPDYQDWWKAFLGSRYEDSAVSTSRWLD